MELGLGLTKIIPPALYLVGIVIVVLTLLYKAEVGIFFLVPLLTLQTVLDRMVALPGGKDFIDILFLAVLVKWLMSRDKSDEIMKSSKSLNWIILAIVAWTHIALWIGSLKFDLALPTDMGNPRFVAWKNFIMLPILYLLVVNNIKDAKHIKWILILMAFSMLFMDRNFYHNFQGKDTSHYHHDLRVGATFSYLGPNETAVFYAQNTIIVLCLVMGDKEIWRRMLFGLTTGFNYFCLIFLYSRGGYLAALVSLLFYGLAKNRLLFILLMVVLVSWRTFTPLSVQERIDMSRTEQGTDTSISARYQLWDQAIDLIGRNTITGVGYATTPYLDFSSDGGEFIRKSLHNGHLELLLELGIIGVLIFALFYGMSIYYGWHLFRISKDPFLKAFGLGFVACVLAVLAGNFAGSYFFYLNVSGFYWVNLGLVVRGIELETKSKPDAPSEEKKELRPRRLHARQLALADSR